MKVLLGLLLLVLFSYVLADRCNANWLDNDWENCVNSTKHCKCFDSPNSAIPISLQKRLIEEYSRINVDGDYQSAYKIFANTVVTRVPDFGIIFSGVLANVVYLYLGDWQITDEYRILNITTIDSAQEDLIVYVTQLIYFENVQNGFIFPANQNIEFVFDEFNLMEEITIYPDTFKIISNLPQPTNLNNTVFCQRMMNNCTGSLQQYTDMNDCMTFIESLPVGTPVNPQFGYTQTCRKFHSTLALTHPAQHCEHCGKDIINVLVTPCI